MKLIGLDVGTKRIGVAKADTSVRIAIPVGTLNVNAGREFVEIARIARAYGSNTFVVGLPRSNEGRETAQTAYVRQFAKQLSSVIPGAKIYFQDESLTSVEAKARLKARKGNGYAKGEVDTEAAAIILQDCIERLSSRTPAAAQPARSTRSTRSASAKSAKSARPTKARTTASSTKPAKKSPKNTPDAKNIIFTVVISLILLIGLTTIFTINWYHSALAAPVIGADCQNDHGLNTITDDNGDKVPVESECAFAKFSIKENESAADIAKNLRAAGFIRSDLAFCIYLRLTGRAAQLKAGEYDLRATMSVAELAELLTDGSASADVFNFTVIPGDRIADIEARLTERGYPAADVYAAFTAPYEAPALAGLYSDTGDLADSRQPLSVQLEGYLFGETYEFYNDAPLATIITRFLSEMSRIVTEHDLESLYAVQGLSLREGIILASIVQQEASTVDMPGVAGVFLNRLNHGMTLGSDVTAKYAVDLVDPARETYTDNSLVLAIDSPYNTRKYPGLPPGPIGSPSLSALLAVAHPEVSDYLYFLTGDDQKVYYSSTEAGHNQNVARYCQVLCNIQL